MRKVLLSEAVRRVGEIIGRRPLYVPTPLAIQKVIAWLAERIMKITLLSLAQRRILAEGIVEALPPLRCASPQTRCLRSDPHRRHTGCAFK